MADADAVQPSELTEASGQIISVLRSLLAERYPDLGRHVNTVARLCGEVGPSLELSSAEREALTRAAFLHDIGKLALPESILRKPEPLDEDEWRQMRLHTVIGERILRAAGVSGRVVDFVRSSHERIDGTGYPDGLKGTQIPFGARIIAACDAYDAMTNSRPYRLVPMTSYGAVLELMRGSGTQFDSVVVGALSETLLHHDSPVGTIA